MVGRRLVEKVARIVGSKLEDPRSREAARKALLGLGGEGKGYGRRAQDPAEKGYRAGERLRDRVAQALVLSEREEDLRVLLREAIAEYNREARFWHGHDGR